MMHHLRGAVGVVLAEAGPDKAPENNPEWGKAAPTGLFVLLVFVVACYFLFRSMNRHIKKVPSGFGSAPAEPDGQFLGEAEPPVPVSTTASAGEQTPPRLGTPEEMLEHRRAKGRRRAGKAAAPRAHRDKDR